MIRIAAITLASDSAITIARFCPSKSWSKGWRVRAATRYGVINLEIWKKFGGFSLHWVSALATGKSLTESWPNVEKMSGDVQRFSEAAAKTHFLTLFDMFFGRCFYLVTHTHCNCAQRVAHEYAQKISPQCARVCQNYQLANYPSASPRFHSISPIPAPGSKKCAKVKESPESQTECIKIVHRHSLAIFTADSGIGDSRNKISLVCSIRREHRRSLAIWIARKSHILGPKKSRDFAGER